MRNQRFACAGFSREKHAAEVGTDAMDLKPEALHRGAATDQAEVFRVRGERVGREMGEGRLHRFPHFIGDTAENMSSTPKGEVRMQRTSPFGVAKT